jgi:hypothetical protein
VTTRRIALVVVSTLVLAAAPHRAHASAVVVWWDRPTYTTPILVVDTAVGTFDQPWKRAAWKRIRDRALAAWGVPMHVIQRDPRTYPPFDGTHGEAVAIPGAIRIGFDTSGNRQSYGGWWGDVGGGIAVVTPWKRWWEPWAGWWGAVGHEVGHALGLGHPTGGPGIMAGAWTPSGEELTAVQSYYGRGGLT